LPLNMTDVAKAHAALTIDVRPSSPPNSACPVVETVAVQHNGHANLLAQLQHGIRPITARHRM
jgi:hypothetical protein